MAVVLAVAGLFVAGSVTLAAPNPSKSPPASAPKTPDFTISATSSQSIYPGYSGTYEVTVTPTNGFTGTVSLSVSGMPSGVTSQWTRTQIPGGSGTTSLIVSASSSAPNGSKAIMIVGTSGSLAHTTSPSLTVGPLPSASFTMSLGSPSAPLLLPGGSVSYPVTIVRNNFQAPVTFSIPTDLPSGVTASFNPNPTPSQGNTSTLTFHAAATAQTGTFPFTVEGDKGGFSIQVGATLTVQTPLTLSGNATESLYPDGTVHTIPVKLTSTNPAPVTVTGLSVTIGNLPAGCTLADFAITQSNVSAGNPLSVPASGSVTLPSGGVTAPTITYANNGVQDMCQGKTLTLGFTSTGGNGSGSGGAGIGSLASFTIAGSPLTGVLLYPGGAKVPVNLVLTNPNSVAITVTGVTTTISGTTAVGCGSGNFSVSQQLTASPSVPASSTKSLQDLGVPQSQWPQLQMLDSGNQNSCKNATVNLSYSGTAHS